MKVAIIIPCYNGERWLADAIESALAQDYEPFEVIFVDDGSKDGSRKIAERYADRIKIIHKENGGLISARNAGMDATEAEVVCFLDPDDLLFPDKLKVQAPLFQENPKLALCYADCEVIDEKGNYLHIIQRDPSKGPGKFSELVVQNFIPSPTVMVRVKALKKAGGFDETLKYCEDHEMWIRLAARWPIAHVPETVASWRLHGGNTSLSLKHYEGELLLTKRLQEMYPHIQRLAQKRNFHTYVAMGDSYLARGDRRAARKYYLRAAASLPFKRRGYVRLLSTLIGGFAVDRIVNNSFALQAVAKRGA
jgi:glycosyltransferase involved in cell wall biosynthesis